LSKLGARSRVQAAEYLAAWDLAGEPLSMEENLDINESATRLLVRSLNGSSWHGITGRTRSTLRSKSGGDLPRHARILWRSRSPVRSLPVWARSREELRPAAPHSLWFGRQPAGTGLSLLRIALATPIERSLEFEGRGHCLQPRVVHANGKEVGPIIVPCRIQAIPFSEHAEG
jgi:hypothetical protein